MKTRKAITVTALALFMGLIGNTYADERRDQPLDIPVYDVEGFCDLFLNRTNTTISREYNQRANQIARNVCIDDEQNAFDYLKMIWPSIPQEVKQECISTNKNRPLNTMWVYTYMSQCISVGMDKYRLKQDSQQSRRFRW